MLADRESNDPKRTICLYSAPDAEFVRSVPREDRGFPFEIVRAATELDVASMSA